MTARKLLQRLKQAEDEWSILMDQWGQESLRLMTDEEFKVVYEARKKRTASDDFGLSAEETVIVEAIMEKVNERFVAGCKSRMPIN